MLVVDSSVALSWCFEDEISPETDAILDQVRVGGAVVPSIWPVEVANVLLQAERRRRLSLSEVAEAIALMSGLRISIDDDTAGRAWREIMGMARADKLTEYDAAYLELAVRCGMPLATRDVELAHAARRAGLTVLP
jgi:predicted nucleic acid-binding protein